MCVTAVCVSLEGGDSDDGLIANTDAIMIGTVSTGSLSEQHPSGLCIFF